MVCTARKIAWTGSRSSGRVSRATSASSIVTRFSATSVWNTWRMPSSSASTAGARVRASEEDDIGASVIRAEDQLAPARAAQVLLDDADLLGLEQLERDVR